MHYRLKRNVAIYFMDYLPKWSTFLIFVLVAATLWQPGPGRAQSYALKMLYAFNGSDNEFPVGLTMDSQGNFYGVALRGGSPDSSNNGLSISSPRPASSLPSPPLTASTEHAPWRPDNRCCRRSVGDDQRGRRGLGTPNSTTTVGGPSTRSRPQACLLRGSGIHRPARRQALGSLTWICSATWSARPHRRRPLEHARQFRLRDRLPDFACRRADQPARVQRQQRRSPSPGRDGQPGQPLRHHFPGRHHSPMAPFTRFRPAA